MRRSAIKFLAKDLINKCLTEAAVRRCSSKYAEPKISQQSQENTCAEVSFLNKVAGLRPATLLQK